MNRQRILAAGLVGLVGLSTCEAAAQAGPEGHWELTISGHSSYVFGDPDVGGGIRVPWEVAIRFTIADGAFQVGSGSARWIDRVDALSQPPGWFSCRPVNGSYLDRSLHLHETPRLRFAGFPVSGELVDGRVILQPGYDPPGNYLAVTYECEADVSVAETWFGLAERGKQILGKRQDAEKRVEGDRHHVRVREVASVPPESRLDLPLRDGWTFAQGARDDPEAQAYRLRRLD